MICLRYVKRYCKEYWLIENYQQAVNSDERFDCHHRKEIDENLTRKQLVDMGLYWNRPADELVFLKRSEHFSIHSKLKKNMLGKRHSQKTKDKISKANKNPSKETRDKISYARKHESEETKRKRSEAAKGHTTWNKGKPFLKGSDNPSAKPVYQIDAMTKAIVKKWNCIKFAADFFGAKQGGNIISACKGLTKTAYGYEWVYVSDYIPPAKNIHEIKTLF